MMKIFKKYYIYFVLIILFLSYSSILNLVSNINKLILNNDNEYKSEVNILKLENKYLKDEINKIQSLNKFASYNYSVTRLSYRSIDDKNIFYINGGKNDGFNNNYALVNNEGVIGIITKTYDDYSECKTLLELNNFSVKINNNYANIKEYDGKYLIINNLNHNEIINLNDIVYTSELGTIKESLEIGKVIKIENNNINKTVYIKPFVNFNDISYMYVIGGND